MSELQNSIVHFASALKKKMLPVAEHAAAAHDCHDTIPMTRADLEQLFSLNDKADVEGTTALRKSEQLERETMSIIRGALYAD